MEYILTKTDIQDLNMLVRTSESIMDTYNFLFELEQAGKANTEEYYRGFRRLKSSISLFNSIFDRINDDYEKNKAYIEHLANQFGWKEELKEGMTPIVAEIFTDDKTLCLYRIFNHLNKKNHELLLKKMNKEGEKISESIPEFAEISQTIVATSTLQQYIYIDISNLVLTMMAQNKNSNEYISRSFSKAKYDYCMLFDDIEKMVISSRGNIEMHPFLIHNSVKGMLQIENNEFSQIKGFCCKNNFMRLSTLLLEIDSFSLTKPEVIQRALYIQMQLRAFLVLADEELVNYLYKEINDKLGAEVKAHLPAKMLLDVFEFYKEDRYIPQIITFNL